jgi:hypothetical protein
LGGNAESRQEPFYCEMKTQIIAASILAGLAFSARATLITHDPYSMAQSAAHEVINIVKWAGTQVKTAETSLNTLRTYEQQVVQLARLGNPAALRNLPVVRDIAELYGTGQQTIAEYQQLRSMTDPRYLQGELSSVTSAYQLQNLNSYSSYQFPSSSFGVAQSAQERLKELEQQRQRLESKRDETLSLLQSATTASDVQKYHAGLVAANGALAEVAARETALMHQVQLQQQQLNAGAAVQRQQITERSAAGFSSDVNTSIDSINSLSTNYNSAPRWPSNK